MGEDRATQQGAHKEADKEDRPGQKAVEGLGGDVVSLPGADGEEVCRVAALEIFRHKCFLLFLAADQSKHAHNY